MPLSKNLDYEIISIHRDKLPHTIAARTKRVYDVVSGVYPLSTFFFHSRAHKEALRMSGIRDGMRVLEVATGSGEMFQRLVNANQGGETVGLDLSPKMAARTLQHARKSYPAAMTHCHAVDARYLPFRDDTFDAVVCCYLLELLSMDDIKLALREFHRVLRPDGSFTLVLIGQNVGTFNKIYRLAGSVAPAFWGRQVDERVPQWMQSCKFRVTAQREVRQAFYPSRVVTATK
ncbi:MAG: methyltransferase domain-containing protein [Acidobacteria bacterium]|nr:methyltransferase domain-containing protein [Acidobacteriota bacterium]